MKTPDDWTYDFDDDVDTCDLVKLRDLFAECQADALESAAKVCDHAVRYNQLKCKQAIKHKRNDIRDGHVTAMDMARECAREIRALIPAPPAAETEKP